MAPRPRSAHPNPRQGPRPLALHLTSAAGSWLSSRAALPLLKGGLLPWRPEFAVQGGALSLALNLLSGKNPAASDAAFLAALDAELMHRAKVFLDGI